MAKLNVSARELWTDGSLTSVDGNKENVETCVRVRKSECGFRMRGLPTASNGCGLVSGSALLEQNYLLDANEPHPQAFVFLHKPGPEMASMHA